MEIIICIVIVCREEAGREAFREIRPFLSRVADTQMPNLTLSAVSAAVIEIQRLWPLAMTNEDPLLSASGFRMLDLFDRNLPKSPLEKGKGKGRIRKPILVIARHIIMRLTTLAKKVHVIPRQ